jgi:hypothetical protein
MTLRFYDLTLTKQGRDVGAKFTDALDLTDVPRARADLYLLLRSAIKRHRGDLRDTGEYALELRERGGSDLLMTNATHGEVQR